MDQVGTTHECGICCNETTTNDIIVIGTDTACHDCVRKIFRYAVESEDNFPPVWAGRPLPLEEYGYVLDPQLIDEYRRKAEQYAIPWNQRVMCNNLEAHASSKELFVGEMQMAQRIEPCPECGLSHCLRCSEIVMEYNAGQHSCRQLTARIQDLKQGKDYQLCPGCESTVQLQDGCNHITCICTQQFCFICGQPAVSNSNHWVRGRCPRYNHVDAGNPMWQEDVLEVLPPELRSLMVGHIGRAHSGALRSTRQRTTRETSRARRQARVAMVARVAEVVAHERAQQVDHVRERATSLRLQLSGRAREQQGESTGLTPSVLQETQPTSQQTGIADITASPHDRSLASAVSVPRIPLPASLAMGGHSIRMRYSTGGPARSSTSQIEHPNFHHLIMHRSRSSHSSNRILARALQAEFDSLRADDWTPLGL